MYNTKTRRSFGFLLGPLLARCKMMLVVVCYWAAYHRARRGCLDGFAGARDETRGHCLFFTLDSGQRVCIWHVSHIHSDIVDIVASNKNTSKVGVCNIYVLQLKPETVSTPVPPKIILNTPSLLGLLHASDKS